MAKKWTPQRITRDIVILLIVLSAAVMAPVSYLASQARKEISEQFIQNSADLAVNQFRAMAGSVEATLGLVRDWGETDAFTLDGNDDLTRLLFPLFGREPLLFGVSVADDDDNSFYLRRAEAGFQSSWISGHKKTRMSEEIFWTETFEATHQFSTNSSYYPSSRPWFIPALSSEGIFWTDPYKFFASGQIGVTASTAYRKDKKQIVVAFDILLDDSFKEIRSLTPSENSTIFIFRRDSKLYVPQGESLTADFISIGDIGDELVRKVHSNWFGDRQLMDNVVSVLHEGQIWWCGFRPLDIDRRTTWICIMVPESDILGHAGKRSARLWVIGICSILIATGLAVWMIRRYGRPTDSTAAFDPEDPRGSVQSIILGGENRYVEFKSTMRMNLHSKKPGKEIEMAWMKGVAGFMNTDGGILLLGVTDDGDITGLERDVFENEDKCRLHFKNVVARHIGADFSKYIRFILVKTNEKTVGVIRCERSSEPVFVKDGNKEHFFIRNGPSSDELPVSQALNYIKHRK